MEILIFNWRDIKNPAAGGAEIYTHEISKRLVSRGHNITLLTSEHHKCKKVEEVDGIKIIRNGGKYLVYLKSRQYYEAHLKKENFDIVIDIINTVPFFTPKFIKKSKIVCLIYQLAREFWFYETRFPINLLGYYLLENQWLKKYKYIPTITISQSTKEDLEKIGFKKVNIVPIGLSVKVEPAINENKDFTFAYLGRLTKAKKPFDILKAFELVSNKYPTAKLYIIGDGYLKENLIKFSNSMKSGSSVIFLGHIEEKDKYKILKEARLLLVSGIREGWSMVVTEANSVGTPAIGYNIPGLRDAIVDRKTGLLSGSSPDGMAKRIIEYLGYKDLQNSLITNALDYSREFLWDKSTNKFERILLEICNA